VNVSINFINGRKGLTLLTFGCPSHYQKAEMNKNERVASVLNYLWNFINVPRMSALHLYHAARWQRINQKLNFSRTATFVFLCKMRKENKRYILDPAQWIKIPALISLDYCSGVNGKN